LIDTFHGGNVMDAARHIGLPQQTLNRIARGKFKQSPRADALEAIASKYPGVTVDWLLNGRGAGPQKVDAEGRPITASRLRWHGIEAQLIAAFDEAARGSRAERGLSRENERKLLETGLSTLAMAPLLATAAIGTSGEMDKRRGARHLEHLRTSLDGAAQYWADFFERLIEIEGVDQVVDGLRKHLPWLILGFSEIHTAERLAKEPGWLRSYAEFLRRDEVKGSSPSQDSAST
jgi:transcriptional regulator with XRE-family HTH domain